MRRPPTPPTEDHVGPRRLLWVGLALLLGLWLWYELAPGQGGREISYSQLREQITQGNVDRVTIKGRRIEGRLAQGIEGQDRGGAAFVSHVPEFGGDKLLALLAQHDVEVAAEPTGRGGLWTVLLGLSPLLLLVGLGVLMFRRARAQAGNMFSVGQNRARLYQREQQETRFDDVAGADGAKAELAQIVDFLRAPEEHERLGGKVPRGVLLLGPPGTGKTLLARAVAGEADAPFFSITGSDFMEMFVGVGASRVREMFKEAKKVAPAIVFIDEIDSIGRRRGAGLGGGHDEREQTLNQLLSELDGFEANESVIVMAATNRPDILDPALLRPGRFDRRVTVELPSVRQRAAILRIHARGKRLADEVDLDELARATPGFSGADLENLLNEAALVATMSGGDAIDSADIEEARDKVMMGLKREGLSLEPEECRMLAAHEAGHAIVAAALPGVDPVHKVSIVPRGQSMGATHQVPRTERYVHTREQLERLLAVVLGGRAAELLLLETLTNGAADDLKRASDLARRMVLDWGMGQRQMMALGDGESNVFLGEELARGRQYSEQTARELDRDVEQILGEALELAQSTLRANRRAVDRLVEALLEREELSGAEVQRLLEERGSDAPKPVRGTTIAAVT